MTHDGLEHFSDAVRRWFGETFAVPTSVQAQAWDEVSRGSNVLAIAPTGSGKTLAAFLFAIDKLIAEKADRMKPDRPEKGEGKREGAAAKGKREGTEAKGVRVLYVSPLKALGADVERNLAVPLEGIASRLRQEAGEGASIPEVRVAMRTGDTTSDARRKLLRNPPDILITTPESLYLMLTSQARETLRTVDTVIVDEIHSLAGNKRGAHLSLSLERLDELLDAPAQRIGLSATVRPVETVARFLGGAQPVSVVSAAAVPGFDMKVQVPVHDMTNIPAFSGVDGMADTRSGASSIWPYMEAADPRPGAVAQEHNRVRELARAMRAADGQAQRAVRATLRGWRCRPARRVRRQACRDAVRHGQHYGAGGRRGGACCQGTPWLGGEGAAPSGRTRAEARRASMRGGNLQP